MKESKKNFAGMESIRNEDYKANQIFKKTIMTDIAKINKTIREISKENHGEDKIIRDLGFFLSQKNTTMNLKKLLAALITIINMKVLEININHY